MSSLDQQFKEKLYEMEMTPPNKVWDNIEGRLHTENKLHRPLFWVAASVAGILILAGTFLLRNPIEQEVLNVNYKTIALSGDTSPTLKIVKQLPNLEALSQAETSTAGQVVSEKTQKEVLIADQTPNGKPMGQTEVEKIEIAQVSKPQKKSPKITMELSLKAPEEYLASAEPKEKPKLGNQIEMYASSQLKNLFNGKPLEKPKDIDLRLEKTTKPIQKLFPKKSQKD